VVVLVIVVVFVVVIVIVVFVVLLFVLLLLLLDNMQSGRWLPTLQSNILSPISKRLETEAICCTETVAM